MGNGREEICKVEGNEIVLRISIDSIKQWLELNYQAKVINNKFYDELAERIYDDQSYSEDFCINEFLDARIEGLLESSDDIELEDEDDN